MNAVTCMAEVWLPESTRRCSRLPAWMIPAWGRTLPLFLCTQHRKAAERRGIWAFERVGGADWFSPGSLDWTAVDAVLVVE